MEPHLVTSSVMARYQTAGRDPMDYRAVSINPPPQNHGPNICPTLRNIKIMRSRIARKSAEMNQSPPQADIFWCFLRQKREKVVFF